MLVFLWMCLPCAIADGDTPTKRSQLGSGWDALFDTKIKPFVEMNDAAELLDYVDEWHPRLGDISFPTLSSKTTT